MPSNAQITRMGILFAIRELLWYSITTLSPIIVIYRQVLPNHRKISIFEGRNMENCVTTLFLKNHQNADFW